MSCFQLSACAPSARLEYAVTTQGGGGGCGTSGGDIECPVMTLHFVSSPHSPTVSGLQLVGCGKGEEGGVVHCGQTASGGGGMSGGGGGGMSGGGGGGGGGVAAWCGYVSGLYAAYSRAISPIERYFPCVLTWQHVMKLLLSPPHFSPPQQRPRMKVSARHAQRWCPPRRR